MKKLFLGLLSLVITVSALGLQVSRARAGGIITYERRSFVVGKGIVYIFAAEGYRQKDLKDARIFVGSDYHDLFCWVSEEGDHIICNAQKGLTQYVGQTAVVYLAGQAFNLIIPAGRGGKDGASSTPLTCPTGQIPGADVRVDFGDGDVDTFWVDGETLAEVQANAEDRFSGAISIEVVSELYCDREPI
ncbi:MAG: hypothetical protein IT313_01000 [Anaerolineales bacterium]|nr:hypothetical protein [Anaerolineales bacterium]